MSERKRVLKPIHAFEMLENLDIESDVEKKRALLKEYGGKPPMNFILAMNFNKNIKMDLPEGMPPMDLKDMNDLAHPDFQGLLATGIPRLKHCTKQSNLKKFKKEEIFYEVLINCPLKDAEILCSAKDRALEELYPSITADFVKSVFPEYVLEEINNEVKVA